MSEIKPYSKQEALDAHERVDMYFGDLTVNYKRFVATAEALHDLQRSHLDWRGVQNPCAKCSGSGRFYYTSTATWDNRPGIIAGRGFTRDVCDDCWGSGDTSRPGEDLRSLYEELRALRAKVKEGT